MLLPVLALSGALLKVTTSLCKCQMCTYCSTVCRLSVCMPCKFLYQNILRCRFVLAATVWRSKTTRQLCKLLIDVLWRYNSQNVTIYVCRIVSLVFKTTHLRSAYFLYALVALTWNLTHVLTWAYSFPVYPTSLLSAWNDIIMRSCFLSLQLRIKGVVIS